MRLIVISNLKDRFPAYVRVTLMLTVMIFISSALMGELLPLLQINGAYRRLGLENSVVLTVNKDEANSLDVKSAVEACNGKYLGVSFRGKYTRDGFAYIQPVEKCYFENLPYSYKVKPELDKSCTGYPAVIVGSLQGYYSVGSTYKEKLSGKDGAEISFTVIGVLKNDYVYLTPSEDNPSSVISEQNGYIFIITDESDNAFSKRNVYGALTEGSSDNFQKEIINTNAVKTAVSSDGFEEYRALELEIMGLRVMLMIISTALCLAGVISNSMLSICTFKEKYRIIFTCGGTRKQCRLIQIITDMMPIISAIIVSAGLYLPALKYKVIKLDPQSIVISFMIVTFVFIISEEAAFLSAHNFAWD